MRSRRRVGGGGASLQRARSIIDPPISAVSAGIFGMRSLVVGAFNYVRSAFGAG